MFDKIAGNNPVKDIFKRLLAKERVPHSLLLVGEEGVGKRLFALEIAKAIICQNPQDFEACDDCGACRRAASFTPPKADDRDEFRKVLFTEHPDTGFVLPYNRNILVHAVRSLETEANFRPYEAKARFFIVDDADKMNDEAANALLKTLEEPSSTTYIFLVTSRPAALLPTIRSRCQIVRFAPLDARQIEGYLERTGQHTIEDAELLSKLSHGSLARALRTDLEKFRERRATVWKVLESLAEGDNRAALLKTAEEINDAKNKDHYETYLDTLQTLIHDLWLVRLGANEETIVNADMKAELARLAPRFETARLAAWLKEIENLREHLAVNVNRKIATDALFMQMAAR